MKNYAIAAAIGSLAISPPVFAQETGEQAEVTIEIVELDEVEEEEGEDAFAMAMVGALLSTMFQPDPLTEEAELRLPQAEAVAGALVPEGVYGRMMSDMMGSFTEPLFEMAKMGGGMSADELSLYTGLYGDEAYALTAEERSELTAIFDPVHEERATAGMTKITTVVAEVFDIIEPGMREGLSKAYAARFTDSELAEINAFFATPTGAKYAAQSLPVQADKHVIAGMMKSVPALIERMPQVIEALESEDGNGLPEPRGYDDLTPSEQRRASELLGVDQETLRESMALAKEAEALEAVAVPDEDWDESAEEAADRAAAEMEEVEAE
tara:strand:- start:734 stop:1708 length:975 start_codon:yes stop_codon:yes gene_type:complete